MLLVFLPALFLAIIAAGLFGGGSEADPAEETNTNLTQGDDDFQGGGAAQKVNGLGGDDRMQGGAGDDALFGGAGQDNLLGGNDDDLLRGGDGRDILIDSDGNNQLFGDLGQDILDGRDGTDDLRSGDQLWGGYGADVLIGDAGDTLTGGAGDDVLMVSSFTTDTDVALITDFTADDRIEIEIQTDGGLATTALAANGTDLQIMVGSHVVAVLQGVTGISPDQLVTTYADVIPNPINGTSGPDTITGTARDDLILGQSGDDILFGGSGADRLEGGDGRDTLNGDGGPDQMYGGAGDDVIDGRDGGLPADRSIYDYFELLNGGEGNDLLLPDSGDAVNSLEGSDIIHVAPGQSAIQLFNFNSGPGQDRIEIEVPQGQPDPTLELVYEDDAADGEFPEFWRTLILVDGRAVFTLDYAYPRNISLDAISFVRV
jgi:Ca2+-binding RTX toxin-like protein